MGLRSLLFLIGIGSLLPEAADYYSNQQATQQELAAAPEEEPGTEAEQLAAEAERVRGKGTLDSKKASLELYTQALSLWRAAGDRPRQAEALHQMGTLLIELGDFLSAAGHLEQALPIWEETGELGKAAETLAALAYSQQVLGRIDLALDYYRDSLSYSQSLHDLSQEAATTMGMGFIYDRSGAKQEAIDHLGQAVALFRQLGDRKGEGYALTGLSTLWLNLGDHERALEAAHRALPLLTDTGDRRTEATLLGNIGLAYQHSGDPSNALAYYRRSLDLHRAIGDRIGEAKALHNLGVWHQGHGGADEAVKLLHQALETQLQIGDLFGAAKTYYDLGAEAVLKGEPDKAEDYFRHSLEQNAAVKDPLGEALAQAGLARIVRDRGQLDRAREKIEIALAVADVTRSGLLSPELRSFFSASLRDLDGFNIDLLARLHQLHPAKGYDRLALLASERHRSRSLVELLTLARKLSGSMPDPTWRSRLRENERQISKLQSAVIAMHSQGAANRAEISEIEIELEKRRAERKELELQRWQQEEVGRELATVKPIQDLEGMQSLLDDHTALLEYSVGAESSTLFVVTKTDFATARLPAAPSINDAVESLRQALSVPAQTELATLATKSRFLFDTLVKPAEALLRGKTDLIVVPDGALYYLPFETLLAEGDSGTLRSQPLSRWPFLIQRFAISYSPSMSLLASLHERRVVRSEPAKAFLAYGDPVYRGKETAASRAAFAGEKPWEARPLPQTRREVEEIGALFGKKSEKVTLFLGTQASEENVKTGKHLREHRYIHFAVHGLLNEKNPEYSGLLLTLPDASIKEEDGLLQAYEIVNLDLACDMVVLSACETGLGRLISGEGVAGLWRAFLSAGADSLVVSLWAVSDVSTRELMVRFYRHLVPGKQGRSEALRAAQLEMIQQKRFAHPFHWGAFALVGLPGELRPASGEDCSGAP